MSWAGGQHGWCRPNQGAWEPIRHPMARGCLRLGLSRGWGSGEDSGRAPQRAPLGLSLGCSEVGYRDSE